MTSKIPVVPPPFEFSDSDDDISCNKYVETLDCNIEESSNSVKESISEQESEYNDLVSEDDDEMPKNLDIGDMDDDNIDYDSFLSTDDQSQQISVTVPSSFSPDKEAAQISNCNIYNRLHQADVNYMSTKYILSSIISCKCSKKNLMGYGCLEQVSSLEDLQKGSLSDSISLITNIRNDILTMSDVEKHKYIAKLVTDTVIKGNSQRLMVKYRLTHQDFKNGKCY